MTFDLDKYEAMLRKHETMSDEQLEALPLKKKIAILDQLCDLMEFAEEKIQECKQLVKIHKVR